MKIYVLGSNSFMREMVAAKDELRKLGYDGWIHPDYVALVRGEKKEPVGKTASERAALNVNLEKNGIKNYIGGNALIEMGQAYVNNKIIFLLNEIPQDLAYTAEIECMDPVCLHGDLHNIAESGS
jgi:hypothetical protein